jgi:hypothetical protein
VITDATRTPLVPVYEQKMADKMLLLSFRKGHKMAGQWTLTHENIYFSIASLNNSSLAEEFQYHAKWYIFLIFCFEILCIRRPPLIRIAEQQMAEAIPISYRKGHKVAEHSQRY